ncbi:MAG TPA: UDP-N-acetylmuramate dehydrogenase [Desulfuromonadaceae bacterium]|jgi:UDP-N-acetylmuramate dehydrogenase
MDGTALEKLKQAFRGELLCNEPLARHISLKVGGPADLFAVPVDKDDLQELLRILEENKTPWFIIGGGYNLLVKDDGFRGAAVSLKNLNRLELSGQEIYAEAGASNQALAYFARDNNLSGLEFLAGIPGSVGGALCMNAGAHGVEIFDLVSVVEMFNNGKTVKYLKNTLNYGYRRLQVSSNEFIIAANFRLTKASRDTITAGMENCLLARRQTQTVGFPNAGSFFKNPPGLAAWRLIDESRLRGRSCGGAQVSEVHSNFLVNCGNATADNFLQLAAIIKERVLETSGVRLEEEVKIIGD